MRVLHAERNIFGKKLAQISRGRPYETYLEVCLSARLPHQKMPQRAMSYTKCRSNTGTTSSWPQVWRALSVDHGDNSTCGNADESEAFMVLGHRGIRQEVSQCQEAESSSCRAKPKPAHQTDHVPEILYNTSARRNSRTLNT